MEQELLKIFASSAVGLIGVLGGWWMRIVWEAITELRTGQGSLTHRVTVLELLHFRQYESKQDFDNAMKELSAKYEAVSKV